jgi:hypothetical protein
MPDTIPQTLVRIGNHNRLLADELAKLPELGKLRIGSSGRALANLFRIYRFAPNRFDRMFLRMNTVGRQQSRKYCAPLQAWFWMIQDEKWRRSGMLLGLRLGTTRTVEGYRLPSLQMKKRQPSDGEEAILKEPDYTLIKILDAAWSGETELMFGVTIHQIIAGIRGNSEAEEYTRLEKHHSDAQLQGYIMDDYLKKKEIFSGQDWAIIGAAINRSRWKQFYTVADRLNSPELVSYYIDNYFFFRKRPASGVYFTFFEKKAQCTDAAYFAQFMLERAGYRTFMRSVKWSEDPWDGLHTGAGVILEDDRYLLVSNYTGINSISGPYADVEGLDDKLSCNRKIIGSKWGAYYPPRYY